VDPIRYCVRGRAHCLDGLTYALESRDNADHLGRNRLRSGYDFEAEFGYFCASSFYEFADLLGSCATVPDVILSDSDREQCDKPVFMPFPIFWTPVECINA
jgi:hypothetical protein